MWIVHPAEVSFGTLTLEGVGVASVDRVGSKVEVGYAEGGAHAAFVDVTGVRTAVRLVQEALGALPAPPALGTQGTLSMVVAPDAGDSRRRRVSGLAVVTGVRHELGGRGGRRIVEFELVSAGGAADPLVVEAL